MTDLCQGTLTDAAAMDGTPGGAAWDQLQGDKNENCEDCGEGRGLQPTAESRVRSCGDEQVVGDYQEKASLQDERQCCVVAQEERRVDESDGDSRQITVFVDLRVAFTPAKIRRSIAFVIRPLTVLLWLMAKREWWSSVSLLTELKVPALNLIACLADVHMAVAIDGATESGRKATESTVFVLLVLAKLLFSVRQFAWCKRVAKVMWGRFQTPLTAETFGGSKYLVCPARTLPDLYGSKTCAIPPWGREASGCFTDHLLGTCARFSEALAGEEQGQPIQVCVPCLKTSRIPR
ncbi:uncharacterized protein LOC144134463 [Amblyomma americanum]